MEDDRGQEVGGLKNRWRAAYGTNFLILINGKLKDII